LAETVGLVAVGVVVMAFVGPMIARQSKAKDRWGIGKLRAVAPLRHQSTDDPEAGIRGGSAVGRMDLP
jgi:hypothetical protein